MMRYLGGVTNLNAVAGGTLLHGFVPWHRLARGEYTFQNAGALTITAGGIQILSLNFGVSPSTRDRFLVDCEVVASKGVTAGINNIFLQKASGGATVQTLVANTLCRDGRYFPASGAMGHRIFGLWEVTAGGTLVMELRGDSQGSDSTVAINGAKCRIVHFVGDPLGVFG